MRRTVAIAIASLVVSASVAEADGWQPGWEHFVKTTFMAGKQGMGPQTGEWLAVLPTVTHDCDMKIDKGHMQLLLGELSDMDTATFVADRMSKGYPNPLDRDWQIMMEDNKVKACMLIDSEWGEDGDLYPGLIKRM